MSLKNYYTLSKHIKNWKDYFKRVHEKNEISSYITKGRNLTFKFPPIYFFVFKEIFMEDFYKIDALLKNISNNATIVDIGCNTGLFSFMVASKKTKSKIFAYDPMKLNTEIFEKNIALNYGLNEDIKVFNVAVTGTKQGTIDLYFDNVNNDSVIASIYPEFSNQNNTKTTVNTITLEEIITINNLEKIDLLKLDCEGSEYPIIYETPKHIFNKIDCLTIETHELDNDKKNTPYLEKYLTNLQYKIEKHQAENGCYSLRVYK